jgi:endonuclease/exonuclease/phosphatase (EEP) superfamily protein YafD
LLLTAEFKITPAQGTEVDAPVKRKKPRHRQLGAATLGLLIAVGGLVAGRLGQLYPHFDVFAQFGMQFVMMATAFTVAAVIPRFKAMIGMALLVALMAGYSAWPHVVSKTLQPGPFQLAAGETPLRVAHFNTFKNNTDHQAIADEVLRLDADVVSLVEMSRVKKNAVLPLLQVKYPFIYDCAGVDFCDIAIVSKHTILDSDGQAHWVGPPYARVTLGGAMEGITVLAVHTTRFPHSRWQLRQVQALVKHLETYPGERIVMGDFNATPFSRVLATLQQGAKLERITTLPTWPAQIQMPQLAIDHIFVSEGLRVVGKQQIGDNVGSDHYPIVATLARKAAP